MNNPNYNKKVVIYVGCLDNKTYTHHYHIQYRIERLLAELQGKNVKISIEWFEPEQKESDK